MGNLIYAANMSLDGYTEDAHGRFDWAPLNDDVFAAITELMRSAGTYLYGRRMYETMAGWETQPALATQSPLMSEYANVWRAAEKIVYSTTLADAPTQNTRLVRHFDADAIAALKREAQTDLIVGGPNLAAQAFSAGLIDECHLLVWPVILGGRNPALAASTRRELTLVDEHRFANGVVHLRYAPA